MLYNHDERDNTMNVLSIDFDYFQLATIDQFKRYPTGIDRTAAESEKVWSETYKLNPDLCSVKLNTTEYHKLIRLIKRQPADIPVMIVNSHVEIYDFIHDHVDVNEKLNITHIDTHDDFYNDNPCLDCGNWLRFIADEYKDLGFVWISNPISADVYGFDTSDEKIRKIMPTVLDSSMKNKYDLIFLCRSDTWLPPHLDSAFTDLCRVIQNKFTNLDIRDDITIPRKIA